MSTQIQSRFFAVKTTGGQEQNVAKFVGNRLERDESSIQSPIRSIVVIESLKGCLLYTSPSPRDRQKSRMPSSA